MTSSGTPALLFQRLRVHLLRNYLRSLLGHSIVRPLTILLTSLTVVAFVFVISYAGFVFLQGEAQLFLGGEVVGILFDLLFFALAVMLVFSTGLILYSSLFGSAETAFLLSSPVPADRIFAFKFQGAVAFSSWAFLLLGGPILVAYGLVAQSPGFFYLLLPAFFLGFVLIPGALGALLTLLIVVLLPQRRKQLLIWTCLILAALLVFGAWRLLVTVRTETWNRDAVQRLVGRFDITRGTLTPSHWIARGLRTAGRGDLQGALYDLGLVWSNGLFFYVAAAWAARRLYRRGYNRLATGGTLRRRYGSLWLDRVLGRLLFFLDPQTRLLIVKDFRTFRREPAQWAQILIFSGLMILYFINIRRMFVGDIGWAYQNVISVLNLCATALLLCTYTGRFIYPLLSLEGRKFWILGLLPLQRDRLLWGKFIFAATGALLISCGLVLLSDLMIGMPLVAILLHLLTVGVLAAGLSGLSVGLGALMPNFKETDPSKIAVGFGGTLNLVAGLGFLLFILALMAGPWHAFAVAEGQEQVSLLGLVVSALSAGVGVILGSLAVFIPLRLGIRRLREMEF
jgi:ABC-2 type transport system permease protein